jgi:hypothetical protein
VRFIWFNLMPWPDLPEDFREKYRSVWVGQMVIVEQPEAVVAALARLSPTP